MPSSETAPRQRNLGGIVGLVLLAAALLYHFFPRVFHVDPAARDAARAEAAVPAGASAAAVAPAARDAERNAGPPLALAPTAVLAARLIMDRPHLPVQRRPDPPALTAQITRARKALRAGRLDDGPDAAAALFLDALKRKPDSRAAAQGVFDVHARLSAQIGQDIAIGDAESARGSLVTLQRLPGSQADVAQFRARLAMLDTARPLLAHAATLLQQGRADQPSNGNALALYRQVERIDPDNAVAAQGLLQVQRVVLDRALAAVAQNDFAAADRALASAAPIQSGSAQWQAVHDRIAQMRRQRADGSLEQARSALDAGNPTLAAQRFNEARGMDPQLQGLADFEGRMRDARLYAGFRPGQVVVDRYLDVPGQGPAMVVLPVGRFQMGSTEDAPGHRPSEAPPHEVTIAAGFALARSEVTVAQFRQFVRASGYAPDALRLGASVYDERTGALRPAHDASWEDDYEGRPAEPQLPVINVSWNDARAYTQWLSQRTGKVYRLPSEAEFEYATRAGSSTPYWWGDARPPNVLENLTGSLDRSPRGRRWSNAFKGYRDGYWGPAPVMHFAANPFGLYDIDGNVSEWQADCWHDSYLRAPSDSAPWINPGCSVRVVRGGSWASTPDQARSAYRQGTDARSRSARIGFRVVREL